MGTVTLPEVKIQKCREIFNHSSLAPGTRRILIHTVQVARGNGEWAAQVQPLLRIEMKVLDTLLGGASPGATYAQPPLTGDALEEFWVEFDESIEFLRLLFNCEHLWKGQWTNSMEGLLDVSERLALPGRSLGERSSKALWCSGDATLEHMAFINWGDHVKRMYRSCFFTLE